MKQYEGGTYTSTHPSDNQKKLNPYAAIPPIHHKDQPAKGNKKVSQKAAQPAVVDMGGSYMDAYYVSYHLTRVLSTTYRALSTTSAAAPSADHIIVLVLYNVASHHKCLFFNP